MASASPIAHSVKSLPVMQETRVQFLGQEDPLDRGAWQATVYGVARVGHGWVTKDTQPIGYVLKSLEKKLHFSKNYPGLKQSG